MILKEAFRYQNFYDKLIDLCYLYLSQDKNTTNCEQLHLKNAANKDDENETVILPKVTTFENEKIVPTTVMKFLMDVYEEKRLLTNAIAVAKKNMEIDIDSEIALNKVRQRISGIFNHLSNIKARENRTTARANKFNVNGDQVTYTYNVDEKITIDFDRNLAKNLSRKLNELSDKASTSVDLANITVNVDFKPKYALDDTFEDCLEKMLL